MANEMVQELESFLEKAKDEAEVKLKKAAQAFFNDILKPGCDDLLAAGIAAWKHLEPRIPQLVAEAVLDVVGNTGDKRKAALQQVARNLGNDAINAAIAGGEDEASAIASQYGVDPNSVNLLLETTVQALKSRNMLPSGTEAALAAK
ncbi:MAG: hypothetical protein ACYDFU_02505 [Nitrospirota bacterium]